MLFIRSLFSRTLRQARGLHEQALKILNHQRDVLPEKNVTEVSASLDRLGNAIRTRAGKSVLQTAMEDLEATANKWLKPYPFVGIRDWIDTILVAGSLAIAFRTFFFQPMVIPTGSAQPTFNGITHVDFRDVPGWKMPSFPQRVWDYCIHGYSYHEVIARSAGMIDPYSFTRKPSLRLGPLQLFKKLEFRAGTDGQVYQSSAPDENAEIHLGLLETIEGVGRVKQPRVFKIGDPIVRCRTQTGDHLFVNRMVYNYRHPARGETIVFRSEHHPGLTPDTHYIKRLVGLGGERIRIGNDRHISINGRRLDVSDPGFEKVYSFDPAQPPRDSHYSGHLNGTVWAKFFGVPGPTDNFRGEGEFTIRPGHCVTFGDNTVNSYDSRAWGEGDFPQQMVIGRSGLIFWPFSDRWGWSQK